jgi:hypothetical protein
MSNPDDLYEAGMRAGWRGVLMVAVGALSSDPEISGKRLLKILAQDVEEREDGLPVYYRERLDELEVFDDTD